MKTRKEEYIDKMAKDLKEWSATIDEFEANASRVVGEMQEDFARKLVDLKEKRDTVTAKLSELQGSAGEAWSAMQSGVEKAKHDLRDAFQNAKAIIKKAA